MPYNPTNASRRRVYCRRLLWHRARAVPAFRCLKRQGALRDVTESAVIRCRMVACRDKGDSWSFYLVNDNNFSLDEAILYEVNYEWGDWQTSESTDVHIVGLAPGGNAMMWRDDGSGAELRMELCLRVQHAGRVAQMKFEFPTLYRKKDLPVIDDLGRPGWQESGEARLQ